MLKTDALMTTSHRGMHKYGQFKQVEDGGIFQRLTKLSFISANCLNISPVSPKASPRNDKIYPTSNNTSQIYEVKLQHLMVTNEWNVTTQKVSSFIM